MKLKKKWFLETIIFFAIFIAAGFLFNSLDPVFLNSKVHPYWIVVILIASRYGLVPGVFAGLTAAFIVVYFSFGHLPTRNDIEKMIESRGLILPLAFAVAGFFLGNIRQKYIDKNIDDTARIEEQEKVINNLKERVNDLDKTRKGLEDRIVRSSVTIRTLYESSRKIELMEDENVNGSVLKIMAENFQIEKASFYEIKDDYFVISATLGWPEGEAVEGKIKIEDSIMSLALKANKYLTAKEIVSMPTSDKFIDQYGKILASFPVKNRKSEVVGLINVEKIDFILFTKQNLQMIALLTDWIGIAIDSRQILKQVKLKMIIDNELDIYAKWYLKEVLERECSRGKVFNIPFVVTILKINRFGFLKEEAQILLSKTLVSEVKRTFGLTDMMFKYKFDGTFAVISPCRGKDEIESICDLVKREFTSLCGKEMGVTLLSGCVQYKKGMFQEELLAEASKGAGIRSFSA
ncbi:MAG: hypothetical protein HQL29_02330 [Candidatus Omnitrophica bacterium]|nr:hypothetical protein [Candidatus Omnitrophota bacterium]